jgi:hypothetical protein
MYPWRKGIGKYSSLDWRSSYKDSIAGGKHRSADVH